MAKNFMKSQGPRANSLYKQGKFLPSAKYLGDPNKCIYRSSWELRFLIWLEKTENVLQYTSENVIIPYFDPLSKRMRQYYVDFGVTVRSDDGKISTFLLEVKPSKYIAPPKTPKRMTDKQTESFLYSAKQYIINQAKFEAAKQFAAERGMKFGIVTENFIFKHV